MNISDEQKLEWLKRELEKGESDIKAGRVKPAAEVFKRLREKIKKSKKRK